MGKLMKYFLLFFLGLILINIPLSAATTGKIAGRVTDEKTGKGLPGVNVIVSGTGLGASANADGYYFIINMQPGSYIVECSMIGYARQKAENIRVSANSTTNIDFLLNEEVIEGEVVVVTANAMSFKRDQVSSKQSVSSEDLAALPVLDFEQVVNLQAGVVDGHFRGGRSSEVAYLVDGMQVTDNFSGGEKNVSIENEAIEDAEIITGTFNAEYGKAMSGIVNTVVKEGGQQYKGHLNLNLGNYYPIGDDYIGLEPAQINRNQDYRFSFSGPLLSKSITFFTNVRYQDLKNHLNGINRFNVDDYSVYGSSDSSEWIDTHNGDDEYVSLSGSKKISFLGKLTAKVPSDFKMSLLYTRNLNDFQVYSHRYKYNPNGLPTSHRNSDMLALMLNYMPKPTMFMEGKISYLNSYYGSYVYEDALDSRYVHDQYFTSSGSGFLTGGQNKNHAERFTKTLNAKFDITWQATQHHSFKTGVLYTKHDIDQQLHSIENEYKSSQDLYSNYFDVDRNTYVYDVYKPITFGNESVFADDYIVNPEEFSAYIQDKMEYDEMVISLGVRMDYFDPKISFPSNLRNPANQLRFPDNPERMSTMEKAEAQYNISPRFGLSYKLSDKALLHFSYGHFFQIPPLYSYYENNSFVIEQVNYATHTGNALLKGQKTVQYEVGLWQQLTDQFNFEINVYYRDIYDLLSDKVLTTYNQVRYGMYTNKDYGNVKGMELKLDFKSKNVGAFINYTLMFTRGIADNPMQNFTRAGDQADPIPRLIPLNWDQRHSLNMNVRYMTKNFTTSLIGVFNSGTRYTWTPLSESRLSRVNLYPNNSVKPATVNFDLYTYYTIPLKGNLKVKLSLLIQNLLDTRNAEFVNSNTGEANESIVKEINLITHRSLYNDYYDVIYNPAAYSTPRYIQFGVGLEF